MCSRASPVTIYCLRASGPDWLGSDSPEIVELLKIAEGDTLEFATTNGDVVIRKGKQ